MPLCFQTTSSVCVSKNVVGHWIALIIYPCSTVKQNWWNVKTLSVFGHQDRLTTLEFESIRKEGCSSSLAESLQDSPLQNLIDLELTDLKNLRSFAGAGFAWSSTGVFSNLQKLYIYCPKIKQLFPLALLEQNLLPELQKIAVDKCDELEKIFSAQFLELRDYQTAATQGTNYHANIVCTNSSFSLPRLKSLCLTDLPNLKSICDGQLLCESLELFLLEGCHNLEKVSVVSCCKYRIVAADGARL